jgi:transcriptional regulator with XRE-family HTH domain
VSPIRLRVQHFRERKGWSQAELARRSGVAQPIISRVEAGKTRTLSLENLEKIAAALDVAPGSLLERSPKPARSR